MWFDKLTTNVRGVVSVRPEPVEGPNNKSYWLLKWLLERQFLSDSLFFGFAVDQLGRRDVLQSKAHGLKQRYRSSGGTAHYPPGHHILKFLGHIPAECPSGLQPKQVAALNLGLV